MSNENNYGKLPRNLGQIKLDVGEMMCYLYLPVKMPGDNTCTYEPRLHFLNDLMTKVGKDVQDQLGWKDFLNRYIYVTAKTLWVTPGNPGNRPGWHTDRFMTDDLNYIWYDKNPTVFNSTPCIITPHHTKSIQEFNEQVDDANNVFYENCNLLALDSFVIHKCIESFQPSMRTFIKISVSKHKYNLEGNSHNYLLDYDWNLHSRKEVRNEPNGRLNETDFVES
jgi:hypothetical protein